MVDNPTITVPISTDKDGNIRIGGTRVTLEVVIARYQQGYTPEQINGGFPTLRLADIYALITYYLYHKDEVEAYLLKQKQEAEQIRREIEAKNPEMFALEAKLRERLAKKQEQ